jgi:hypothetical protein
MSDLVNVLRGVVRDHASDLVRRARFRDGAEYHRELIDPAPELAPVSRSLRTGGPRDARKLPEDFELWLLSWLPGQVTPIHDHGGAVTVTTVLSGSLVEERFDRVQGNLVRPIWTMLREVGDIDAIEPTTIHRVRPLENAVTLHLYVPTCVEGRTYELAGDSIGRAEIKTALASA